jgi:hypothetical protein
MRARARARGSPAPKRSRPDGRAAMRRGCAAQHPPALPRAAHHEQSLPAGRHAHVLAGTLWCGRPIDRAQREDCAAVYSALAQLHRKRGQLGVAGQDHHTHDTVARTPRTRRSAAQHGTVRRSATPEPAAPALARGRGGCLAAGAAAAAASACAAVRAAHACRTPAWDHCGVGRRGECSRHTALVARSGALAQGDRRGQREPVGLQQLREHADDARAAGLARRRGAVRTRSRARARAAAEG